MGEGRVDTRIGKGGRSRYGRKSWEDGMEGIKWKLGREERVAMQRGIERGKG